MTNDYTTSSTNYEGSNNPNLEETSPELINSSQPITNYDGMDLPKLEEMSLADIVTYVKRTRGDAEHQASLAAQVRTTLKSRHIGALLDMGRLEGLEAQTFFRDLAHEFD